MINASPSIQMTILASVLLSISTTSQLLAQETAQADAEPLRSHCEATRFKEYTSHEDMWTYLQALQATTTQSARVRASSGELPTSKPRTRPATSCAVRAPSCS